MSTPQYTYPCRAAQRARPRRRAPRRNRYEGLLACLAARFSFSLCLLPFICVAAVPVMKNTAIFAGRGWRLRVAPFSSSCGAVLRLLAFLGCSAGASARKALEPGAEGCFGGARCEAWSFSLGEPVLDLGLPVKGGPTRTKMLPSWELLAGVCCSSRLSFSLSPDNARLVCP